MNPHQLNNPPISGGGLKTPIKRKGGAGHPGQVRGRGPATHFCKYVRLDYYENFKKDNIIKAGIGSFELLTWRLIPTSCFLRKGFIFYKIEINGGNIN